MEYPWMEYLTQWVISPIFFPSASLLEHFLHFCYCAQDGKIPYHTLPGKSPYLCLRVGVKEENSEELHFV